MCENAKSRTEVGHTIKDKEDVTVNIGRNKDNGELKHMNNTEIGESGWLGNPYRLNDGYSRRESIQNFIDDFQERLNTDPEFRKAVRQLDGETLGCWCRSLGSTTPLCHGDAIRAAIEQLNK